MPVSRRSLTLNASQKVHAQMEGTRMSAKHGSILVWDRTGRRFSVNPVEGLESRNAFSGLARLASPVGELANLHFPCSR